MSQPTGEHATGVELMSGFVKVTVKVEEGLKELETKLEATEAKAKVVGTNIGNNIVDALKGSGAPAAKGFSDSMVAAADVAAKAGEQHAIRFGRGFTNYLSGEGASTMRREIGFVLGGAREGAQIAGADVAQGYMGRFIQVMALNRINAEREAERTGQEMTKAVHRGASIAEASEGFAFGETVKKASEGLRGLGKNAGEAGAEVGEASEKLAGMGALLAPFMDPAVLGAAAPLALAAGFSVVIDKLYELGEKWEEVSHKLEIQTGATGANLAGLEDSVKKVAAEVPLSIGQIGGIVAAVSSSFKDSGEGLDKVAAQVGKLQSMGQQINLTELGKGFRAFGIAGDADAQVDVLNQLFKAYQATQIPIDTLAGSMARAAPIAKQFHLSIGETVAVMSQFDQAGIDPSRTMFTLAKAAQEATKQHKDFSTVLNDEIEKIRNASTEQEKLDIAGQFFGKTSGRGGAAQIVAAVNAGLSLDPETLAKIQEAGGLIDKTREDTLSWADEWTLVKNRISDALEPVSTELREHVQAGFKSMSEWLDRNQGKIVTFATSCVNAFEKIGEGISVAFHKATPVVQGVIAYLEPAFKNLLPHIEKLGEAFGPLLKALGADLLPIVKAVGEALIWMLNEAIKYAPPVIDVLTHIVNALTDVFTWLHNLDWAGIFGGAEDVIKPVVHAVEDIWHAGEKIVDYFNAHILPTVKNLFGIWLDLMHPIIVVVTQIVDALKGLGEYIGEHMGTIIKALGTIFHDTFGPVLDVVKELYDVFKKIGEYISGPLTHAFDDIGKATGKVKDLIDMVPGLGHPGGGPPATAHGQTGLALGGYGGGDIVPAMLEPGEHVTTKEEVQGVGGHENMYVIRQLMRHGILKEILGFDNGGGVPGDTGTRPDVQQWGSGPWWATPFQFAGDLSMPFLPSLLFDMVMGSIYPSGQTSQYDTGMGDKYRKSYDAQLNIAAADRANKAGGWRAWASALGFQTGGMVPIAGGQWTDEGTDQPGYRGHRAFGFNPYSTAHIPMPLQRNPDWFNGPRLNFDPRGSVNWNQRAFWDLGGILGSGSPGNDSANFGMYWGGPDYRVAAASGGEIHPAGLEHREKSWVMDRYKLSKPGKAFRGGGLVQYFDDGGEVSGLEAVKALLAAESGRTPYAFGGYSPKGIDCSGLVAEAVQVYLGEDVNIGQHPMSTGNEAAWLAAHGFKQGIGPEGSFRVGFYNGGPGGGHTALTLPDGTNAESGGSGGGVRLGGGAAGANASEFTDHWYLPPRSIVEPGGYGGTGSGGSGGYGGAGGASGGAGGGGSGGGGPSPEQVAAVDTKVTNAQGKLDVLNQRVTEAQQHLQEVEAKTPKTEKGQPAHERAVAAAEQHLREVEAERDQAQGDLDSVQGERASLTGDNDPKALVAAKDRITEANQRLNDAQAKLDRDRANPQIKPSQITADENAVAAAKERVTKAEQHLQDVENRPTKRSHKAGEGKGDKDSDFIGAIGDAASKGLIENLPQGFSDPTQWGVVKSGAALLKFLARPDVAGRTPGAAAGLSMFGDILSGKGGDVGKDIASLIGGGGAQAYSAGGNVGSMTANLISQVPGEKGANPGGGNTTVINRPVTYNGPIGTDPKALRDADNIHQQNGIRSDIKLARYVTGQ